MSTRIDHTSSTASRIRKTCHPKSDLAARWALTLTALFFVSGCESSASPEHDGAPPPSEAISPPITSPASEPGDETTTVTESSEVDHPSDASSSTRASGLTTNPHELEVVSTVEKMMGEDACHLHEPVLLDAGTPIEEWSYHEEIGDVDTSGLGDLRAPMAYYLCEAGVDAETPASPEAMTLRFFERYDDFMDDFTLLDRAGTADGVELYTHGEQLWTAPTWQADPTATREFMSNETGAQIYTWH